jgi:uncharacterized protein YjiK
MVEAMVMLRSFLRSFARSARNSKRNLTKRRLLVVERLEERSLLSAVPTFTTLSTSAAAIVYGQAETLTVTVAVDPPNAGTPTGGTVTFLLDGSTSLGTAALSSGTATLQLSTLPTGTDLLTANYSGAATFAASSTLIGSNSVIATVAGNGSPGYGGNNGFATAAELSRPSDAVVDSTGDIFIVDQENQRIREVNATTHVITTVAGTGAAGYSGDNGQATAAEVNNPVGIAVDAGGDIFIADSGNNRIREINASTHVITTVAGSGAAGYSGDNGQATAAKLNNPEAVAVDAAGDIYIADYGNSRIREVSASTHVITTVAGNGTAGYSGDNGQATAAKLDNPQAVALDTAGDLFIADTGNNRVREVNVSTHVIATVAGNGTAGFSGDSGKATAAELNTPSGVALDTVGDLFIDDQVNGRIREVNHTSGVITTVAGGGTQFGDNGQATAAQLYNPGGVGVDAAGDIFIADTANSRIREVNHTTGVITTVAGGGVQGLGDNGLSTAAEVNNPQAVAMDSAGDLFIADTENNRIREVNSATGAITTVAGNGIYGYSGDNGQATAAELAYPASVAVNAAGDLFIADAGNKRIREVNLATGVITTVVGNGTSGYSGDNGQATAAELSNVRGVALDAAGDLFVADSDNERIREVNVSTGIISTVAGNGTFGYSGDNGLATAAELAFPTGLAVDSAGDIFVADTDNSRVREVNHTTGVITTIAGNGTSGYSGDNGPATVAELNYPRGVALDSSGNLYIADAYNARIREVGLASDVITTAAGTGTSGYTGDNGTATAIELCNPFGVMVDSNGDVIIADTSNDRVRVVTSGATTVTVTPAATTTTLNAVSTTYGSDADVALTANVAANSPSTATVSEGTVTFTISSGTTTIGVYTSATVSEGTVTDVVDLAPLDLGAGAYSLSAVYNPAAPTPNFQTSSVTTGQLTINPAPTNTTVSVSTGVAAFGQPVTLTATVTVDPPNTDTPNGGAVIFYVGNTTLAAATLNFGTATLQTSTLPLGIDTVTASYGGDGANFAASSTGIGPNSAITTVAGNGASAYTGDNIPATAAALSDPASVAVDSAGDLFIVDYGNDRIREVNSTTGLITTVAGNGTTGYNGDNSPATAAELSILYPSGVVVNSTGDLFIADSGNARVREVNLATGVITTVAGNGVSGFSGDNGPATAAKLNGVEGLAVDAAGNLYIADAGNKRIREVNLSSGLITTVAGNGTNAHSGDNGQATAAALFEPDGVVLDSAGDILIAEAGDSQVREVIRSTGLITTVAGDGTAGYSGDNGQATAAELGNLEGLAVDAAGNLYIADASNNRIREVNLSTGLITTVVGSGAAGYSGDNGPATAAQLYSPNDVATDSAGDLFIADVFNYRIREVVSGAAVVTVAVPTPAFTLTGPSSGTFTAGSSVTVGWTAASVDVSGPTLITLGYDADATAFDANEHWIEVAQVTAANGTASYSWNTTGVAAGTYYLSGYMYDYTTSQTIYSQLGTSIVITPASTPAATFTLTGPGSGTFTAGSSVTIAWNAASVDASGPTKITLGYNPDATAFDANEHWIEVDGVSAANGVSSYSWNTTGMASGTYYLAGYMYDFALSHAVYSHLSTPIVITGGNPPAFTLSGPIAGTFTAGSSVTIQWTAANVDVAGPTKITLGYDADATAFDANQHWLEVNQATAANGAGSYSWNTTGVASGTYYLSSYMYDFSTGKAVYSHLATSIVVTGGAPPAFALTGPTAGTFTAGQTVTIQWTAANVDVAGPTKITLGYDADSTAFNANQHWLEVDRVTAANGAASYVWNTTGIASGTYYLSGYMYDFSTSHAVFSNLGASIVIGGGAPPAFTLTGPSSATVAPGTSVTIQWTAANVDVAGPTKITLGYDADDAVDANEHWIEIDGITAANGTGSYTWNTTSVAAGTYYLGGYLYDFSTSHAVYSHLGTSIVIT